MKILGIMWEENSTAALYVDGQVISAVSQERFSRVKNDERYPKQAIEYVLREGGIAPRHLDAVAFIGTMWGPAYVLTRRYSRFSVQNYVKEQHDYWYPVLYEKRHVNYLDIFRDKLDVNQYPGNWKAVIAHVQKTKGSARAVDRISKAFFQTFRRDVVTKHLQIDPAKIVFVDHSTGHAMYAYFSSPIRTDALVLTADAWGDDVNASVNVMRDGRMRRLHSSSDFVVARLYRYTTLLLGMKPNEHEYKVMGLAAYAKMRYWSKTLEIFKDIQAVRGLGFRFLNKPTDSYFLFKKLFEGHRFDAVAGALQEYTETILLSWMKNALRATRLDAICFAGGVAMNVKANMRLSRLPGVKGFFVGPSPDDVSQAIGACYAVVYEDCRARGEDPRAVIKPLGSAYLGPAITDEEIEDLIRARKLSRTHRIRRRVSPAYLAQLLAKGKIIGRACGRSEFGPRALGNRSILADPRRTDVIGLINDKVKNRDFWMPFAPTILESSARDYLVGYRPSAAPYMTVGFETTPRGRRDLPAGLHAGDKTCRPQVLSRGQNAPYEDLIRAFKKLTGVGGLLNTSFNLHGEPIVQTAADALRVFERSQLDALVLNDVLIEKKRL